MANGLTFDRTGRGTRFDRERGTLTPRGFTGGRRSIPTGRTARPRPPGPEGVVAAERGRSLSFGRETQERGVSAIEAFDPDEFLGADALSSIFDEATRTNFLPQLRALQARSGSRGVRGPIAGALEGDLATAFQRNLMSQVAQFGAERGRLALGRGTQLAEIGGTERAQGLSLLGTELELELAREQAARERKAEKRGGFGSFLGGLAGGVGGFFLGGPAGAFAGASAGSRLGGGLGRSL